MKNEWQRPLPKPNRHLIAQSLSQESHSEQHDHHSYLPGPSHPLLNSSSLSHSVGDSTTSQVDDIKSDNLRLNIAQVQSKHILSNRVWIDSY